MYCRISELYTVEPLFRGHPRDKGKCPLKDGGEVGLGVVIIKQQIKWFSFILPPNLLRSLLHVAR